MPNIPGIVGYIQPGAYSIARTRVGSLSLGGGARVLCIVGLGQTEKVLVPAAAGGQAYGSGVAATDVLIATENIHTLTKYPVMEGSINVWIDGILLQEGSDEWTYDSGQDQYYLADIDANGEAVAQGAVDAVATVLILLAPLARGEQLVVNYVAEDDVNDPETFFDPESLYEKHGFPSISNTLALGAQIAFENNATVVMACQALPLTDQGWEATTAFRNRLGLGPVEPISDSDWSLTFAELEKEELDVLVPLSYLSDTDTPALGTGALAYHFGVQAQAFAHVESQSLTQNRKERMLILGAPTLDDINIMTGQTYGNLPQFINDTSNYTGDGYIDETYGSSFRTVFCVPDQISRVVAGSVETLPGWYLAAAVGGWLSGSTYFAEPLTRKTLVGFNILRAQKYSLTQLDNMAGSGALVVTPLSSGGRIRHGLTTINNGSSVEEEISITAVRDFASKQTRTILENTYVGKVILDTTPDDARRTLVAILNSLVAQELITAYAGVSVSMDAVEPRQLNVLFDIQPVFPLNWIKIDFSIGLL